MGWKVGFCGWMIRGWSLREEKSSGKLFGVEFLPCYYWPVHFAPGAVIRQQGTNILRQRGCSFLAVLFQLDDTLFQSHLILEQGPISTASRNPIVEATRTGSVGGDRSRAGPVSSQAARPDRNIRSFIAQIPPLCPPISSPEPAQKSAPLPFPSPPCPPRSCDAQTLDLNGPVSLQLALPCLYRAGHSPTSKLPVSRALSFAPFAG
jgi:hypothetical protein